MGIRRYKMDLPVNTVNRIRKLFGELGLLTYEQYWKDVNRSIYSCGVTLENSTILRTLGKGMTKDLCLASGYGELMERIENLILFTGNLGVPYTQVLKEWPDVREVHSLQELLSLNQPEHQESVMRVCKELYMDSPEEFPSLVLAGKYYSVKDRQSVYLPYSEIYRGVRSNGMCAGNAPEEALIEGLCEVMERMAIKSIFELSIVPPVVPTKYLKQYESYSLIEELENYGVKVEFRDCSLGKGLPVLGILTVNEKTGKYKYNFGAHPDFEQAMKRCFGEICQVSGGVDSIQEFLEGGLQLNLTRNQNEQEKEVRGETFRQRSNFYKALKNSNGELPIEFFTGEESYEFQEWTQFKDSQNYEEDIRIIVQLLEQDQQQIFIRDVSFLGFPAYQVYVTGYSVVQVDESFVQTKRYQKNRRTKKNEIRLLSRVKKCTDEEKLDLIDFLQLQMNSPKFFNQEKDNNWMREVMGCPVTSETIQCPQYVLALLELSLGKYEDAYEHYLYAFRKGYLKGTEEEYHNVLKVYMELLADHRKEEQICTMLKRYYDTTLVETVQADIKTGNILNRIQILQYVDQYEMHVIQAAYEKIRPIIAQSVINMDELDVLFYDNEKTFEVK